MGLNDFLICCISDYVRGYVSTVMGPNYSNGLIILAQA